MYLLQSEQAKTKKLQLNHIYFSQSQSGRKYSAKDFNLIQSIINYSQIIDDPKYTPKTTRPPEHRKVKKYMTRPTYFNQIPLLQPEQSRPKYTAKTKRLQLIVSITARAQQAKNISLSLKDFKCIYYNYSRVGQKLFTKSKRLQLNQSITARAQRAKSIPPEPKNSNFKYLIQKERSKSKYSTKTKRLQHNTARTKQA